jgi:hypothetical protein
MFFVGAPRHDAFATDAGSAYVFSNIGSSWVESFRLNSASPNSTDLFGSDVSADGNVVLVSAPNRNVSRGVVYVFRYDGSTWTQEDRLRASDREIDDNLGISVDIDGLLAVAGAPGEDHAGTSSGAAYVFRFDGSMWQEEQKLTASDAQPLARFGSSVSIEGSRVVVGAPRADGAAYVFVYSGTAWVEQDKLTTTCARNLDFGAAISQSTDLIVVNANRGSGRSHAFGWSGSTWVEQPPVFSGPSGSDQLGSSVDLSGTCIAIGAANFLQGGTRSGAAFIVDVSDLPKGDSANPFCGIGHALAVSQPGDTIHVAPGVYEESILVHEDVTIVGTAGAQATALDGLQSQLVARTCAIAELVGLTLCNGTRGVHNTGNLTLSECYVSGNYSMYSSGGGIYNSGSLILQNTSVSGNIAYCNGGGIENSGGIVTLLNSTVTNNYVGLGFCGIGGGISSHGTLLIYNSTIAGNSSHYAGPGLFLSGSASLNILSHSIVAGNHSGSYGSGDCEGVITSLGNNLIGDTTGCSVQGPGTGDLLGVDPGFVDPASGVFLLQQSSPCVDAGARAFFPSGVDAGGNPRFLDGDLDGVMVLDIGAYEYGHVQLCVTGTLTSGGEIKLHSSGTPGLASFLFAGISSEEIIFPPFGTLFIDLSASFVFLHLGSLPNFFSASIPTGLPQGTGFVLQGLGIDGLGRGNLSNPVTVVLS